MTAIALSIVANWIMLGLTLALVMWLALGVAELTGIVADWIKGRSPRR